MLCCFLFRDGHRRIDDDMGRTHELEHSAIKCMRGILYCYMRQSDKVRPDRALRHRSWHNQAVQSTWLTGSNLPMAEEMTLP